MVTTSMRVLGSLVAVTLVVLTYFVDLEIQVRLLPIGFLWMAPELATEAKTFE